MLYIEEPRHTPLDRFLKAASVVSLIYTGTTILFLGYCFINQLRVHPVKVKKN